MSIQPLELLPLDIVHPKLQQSFLKCFNDGHTNPNLRPTASYWVRVLKVAINELTLCGKFDNHYYSQNYGKCYWCECATNNKFDCFPGTVRQPQSQVASSRQAPNSNHQLNPAPQTASSSSTTATSSVKKNQSIGSSNTANNNPNASNSTSKTLNNPQTSSANQAASTTAQSSSSSGQNNDNSEFIPWLFLPSLCLVAYTFIHYIRFEGLTISLGVWAAIVFLFGTLIGSVKNQSYTIYYNIIFSLGFPLTGIINSFIHPQNFQSGLWLSFSLLGLFFVGILTNQDQSTKNSNLNILLNNILALISVAIINFPIYHYTKNGNNADISQLIGWSLLVLLSSVYACGDAEQTSIISKINIAIFVPILGVINCYINSNSFLSGWWLVFIISFIIWGVSLPEKNTKTNSTSQVLPKTSLIKTIEVLVMIFVLVLAGYTYSTKVTSFDTSAFTEVILQEDFQNPNLSDWLLIQGAEIKDEALFLVSKQNTIGFMF